MSLGESGFERKTKRTREREFLEERNLVVPWAELVSLIAHHAPTAGIRGGRPRFAMETMLRIRFLQQWFNLSDPAMEEALYDTPMFLSLRGWRRVKTTCPTRAPSFGFATCSNRTT